MNLSYPIGQYEQPETITSEHIANWIEDIRTFPRDVEQAITGLSETELEWQYRPDGWTIAQVVHHCADSHMNSMIRFKWTLTEDTPLIKAYFEDRWAKLPDYRTENMGNALALLKALHTKWVDLLERLTEDDLAKAFVHPETGDTNRLDATIGNYAWHCRHHYAHILQAKEYKTRDRTPH